MFLIKLSICTSNVILFNIFFDLFLKFVSFYKIQFIGPIFLPKNIKKFTFLRPVHIYKKSGVSFFFFKFSRFFIFQCDDLVIFLNIYFFLVFIKYRLALYLCLRITYYIKTNCFLKY